MNDSPSFTSTTVPLLAELERRKVRLDIRGGKLVTRGPADAIKDPVLCLQILGHREMLILAVQCRTTVQPVEDGPKLGHRWTAGDVCGETVLVADKRDYTPRCRLTPGCEGHHRITRPEPNDQ